MNRTITLIVAAIAVSACQQSTTGAQPPAADTASSQTIQPPSATPDTTCDTSLIDRIGEPISSIRVPDNERYRVLGPNDFATTDFVETRTNIDVDADGNIKAVYCG